MELRFDALLEMWLSYSQTLLTVLGIAPACRAQYGYSNATNATTAYFAPNSTGFLINHGFEKVLVQPFGHDGFRVRAWPFKPPTGDEISFIYDPPLEGFENGKPLGMSYQTTVYGTQIVAIRNGNTVVKTYSPNQNKHTIVRLAFFRIEEDGTETFLTNEYAPLKSLAPRQYTWHGAGYEFEASFSFSTAPDEQIFGTGTQQDHLLNKKGNVIDMINFNTHIPTPVFMSSRGYAFVWNSASTGEMEFGYLRNRFTSRSTTLVDYVVMSAPQGDYDLLQRRMSAVTGRAPTPPDFSLGYLHSKLRYENQTEFIQLAQNFHDYDIPVSMLVIDYLSWAYQGDFALQHDLWPDVPAMVQKVKELTGAEIMASLWPSVEDASPNYETMQILGFLSATRTGPGATDTFNGSYIRNYDATNPKAREYLWSLLKNNYFDQGIKNFWIDQADGGNLGEAYNNNGMSEFVQSLPYPISDVLYYAGTQTSAGKLYPWAHQQAIEDGLRNATGTKMGEPCQYLSLSRSGYIGSQRFCSMIWSGDTTSVWETLAAQVASGLSAAATGWSWWTLDIGGFQGDPTIDWSSNIDEEPYRQLYVRWLQWGTFLPFMRNHGARSCNVQNAYTCNNEPWTYGDHNLPIIKSYIDLRYQLKPYVKALFDQFSMTGRMIMRPLYMDFSISDPNILLYSANNSNYTTQQYMFGPSLLVTPVTLPNVTEWTVYLPKTKAEAAIPTGHGGFNDTATTTPWTYWWTNETYAGGQEVIVPAPLQHIPVFYLGSREQIMSGDVF